MAKNQEFMFRYQAITFSFFLVLVVFNSTAQTVMGRIVNEQDDPVPYATLFIQELKEGTITNAEGYFRIQVPPGRYHMVIRSMGYFQIEKELQIDSDSLRLDLVMQRQNFEIKEVLVFPGKEDPAYFIVRKAMARAAYHREKIKHYEADLYIKSNFTFTNIPRLYQRMDVDGRKLKDVLKENMTYVIESHNKITFDYPQQYSQEVISKRTSLAGFDEPPVMGLLTSSFYETRPNQVISPLSPLALKHYNFRYEGFITSGDYDVFKIKVEPKRKSDELVSGYMYIVDQLWCLYSVDFKTQIRFFSYAIKQQYENLGNDNWLPVSHLIDGDFSMLGLRGEFFYGATLKYGTIEENFIAGTFEIPNDSLLPEAKERGEKEMALRNEVAEITAKEELTNRDVRKVGRLSRKILKEQYQDTTIIPVQQSSYKLEDKVDTLITSREYWDTVRTIPLSPAEIRSYQVTDSLRLHSKKSGKQEEQKTVKRKSTVKKILTGHHDFCPDSLIRLGYDGLIALGNYDFNVVDGYKYKQKLRFRANLDSGKFIYVTPEFGYAFHRKAIFWQVENQFRNVLWTNNRLNVDFGKLSRDFKPDGLGISSFLNSTSSWFFAKNYMKLYETSFVNMNMAQRIARGLNASSRIEYNHFNPLENHATYKLSEKKEYEPNVPWGFDENNQALTEQKSFVYGLSAIYRKTQRKPWLEKSGFLFISDFYNIQIGYRQGIKNVFSSESDFSHIDFRFNQQANISPVAGIDWKLNAGTFFHANQLHFSQYKHFSTAEIPVSFSSFSHTFQLLNDYRPSTSQSYLNIGAELRSEYLLLRYLSFLNQRTWSESIHLNYLTTPALKNYWEAGYSINSLFFVGNAGIFAGFNGIRFENVMLKISISGL